MPSSGHVRGRKRENPRLRPPGVLSLNLRLTHLVGDVGTGSWLCGPATLPVFVSPRRAPFTWPGVRPGVKVNSLYDPPPEKSSNPVK